MKYRTTCDIETEQAIKLFDFIVDTRSGESLINET